MEAKALAKYVRISPRKVRQVTSLIKGKRADYAANLLIFTPKKAAKLLSKVLKSALANAEQQSAQLSSDRLFVKNAYADGGPTQKRFRPRARGRADRILKRTSHITVIVSDEAGKG